MAVESVSKSLRYGKRVATTNEDFPLGDNLRPALGLDPEFNGPEAGAKPGEVGRGLTDLVATHERLCQLGVNG
eukprot:7021772-Lingulodinium_polyedra.AAC.1